MKRKLIITSVILVFIIPNTPIIGTEILKRIDGRYFRYANEDASFTYVDYIDKVPPWMDKWVMWGFIEDQRPLARNMEVFRLYRIYPWCFWRWRYYWIVSRHFEYKSWKTIESDRVSYDPENRWQKF